MSRSRKKTPSTTWAGFSNKKDKQKANRKFRRINKNIIHNNMTSEKDWYPDELDSEDNPLWSDWWEQWPIEELDNAEFKKLREVSNVWNFSTDGLARVYAPYELVLDMNYSWKGGIKTTINSAKRAHDWKTLKCYIAK